MSYNLFRYISQYIKNKQFRKKKKRRESSILAYIRFMSESEKEKYNEKISFEELDEPLISFRSNRFSNETKRNSNIRIMGFVSKKKQTRKQSYDLSTFGQYKIRKSEATTVGVNRSATLTNFRYSNNFEIPVEYNRSSLMMRKLEKISKKRYEMLQESHKQAVRNLLTEPREDSFATLYYSSIQQINSFVRGAYEDEFSYYSSCVNLQLVERYKKYFYTFNNIYESVLASNLHNKMTSKDVKMQRMKDIVFLNYMKNHGGSDYCKILMKKIKVVT